MAKIKDVISLLENIAPRGYQENYDNAGLITGSPGTELTGVLITLDCIESVVEGAIRKNCNMIVAHHPIVFKGLKQLNGKNYVERTIIKAIKNDIAIYAIHTNLDNVDNGVNAQIAAKIGLTNTRILSPKRDTLEKLEVMVPSENTEEVLDALHAAGAGNIGQYNNCSFTINGTGRFKPLEGTNPTIGTINEDEKVNENKLELIYPSVIQGKIVSALKKAHPYEEVAYYIHSLKNSNSQIGSGMIGSLPRKMNQQEFLTYLKDKMALQVIRYTDNASDSIQKVAVCGGAGSFLLSKAKSMGADAFVTSDFKYHEFFDSEGKITIADIGHYESEVFTKELIDGFIREKFANIATYLSEVDTNPVKYF
ncbi:Nif3-like dinuclear metal center hexameric protein [Roseivirga misakiensis]|uniref:GTP cyclohydrolase 1 type 2 homolog n=1 Tax=Roseivirga misakiensis TaxID=1563681 RepID=A0A1E5T125_9BACT|nr:Nif3-like dinuclear metal center hexameric protein [Roseivirga misakiensis]OEK05061.1 Nif3-like dinuclear metal center hexameric protein [Roseivirga misakiensis]